jgi:hypothetical protein
MTRDQIISLALEAGMYEPGPLSQDGRRFYPNNFAERFYTLATTREREALQAAQRENEELRARLARAGLEQQRAVLAEREACAQICEEGHELMNSSFQGVAAAIRARSQS